MPWTRPGYNYTPGRDAWSKALDDQSDPRDVAEYVIIDLYNNIVCCMMGAHSYMNIHNLVNGSFGHFVICKLLPNRRSAMTSEWTPQL